MQSTKHTTQNTTALSTRQSTRFLNMSTRIHNRYPNAKFSLFFTESSLRKIVSFNRFIIVVWNPEICCGSDTDGHHDPRTFVVHGESPDYITLDDVIQQMVSENFEIPCKFNVFEGLVPSVNPLDNSENVYVFTMETSHEEKL